MFGESKCDVVFFGHMHNRRIIENETGNSFVCLGASGCVRGNNTFYTFFDVEKQFGNESNYDIYRVSVPFNRKKFEEKIRNVPLPNKEKYAPFTFGIELEQKAEQPDNNKI
jgi:hypothetical protein